MSEESKTPEGDYVMMGSGAAVRGAAEMPPGLDDPSLSQEDRDHRLAIALQQQENAAAYDLHKRKQDANAAANRNRTTRSGTFSRLAAVRGKDHGMLTVPAEYTTENAYVKSDGDYLPPGTKVDDQIMAGATPQQIADFRMAKELQKVEQVGAGTAREMVKIAKEEVDETDAQKLRSGRSNFQVPRKK